MSTLNNTISSKTSQFSKNAKRTTTGMVQDMKIIGFVSKPPSSANKENNKAISSQGQDGKRPAKNPKPRFHFVVFRWPALYK